MAIHTKRVPAHDVVLYRQSSFGGAMRKHAGFKAEHSVFAGLDAIAARKVAPTGLIIRRKG